MEEIIFRSDLVAEKMSGDKRVQMMSERNIAGTQYLVVNER